MAVGPPLLFGMTIQKAAKSDIKYLKRCPTSANNGAAAKAGFCQCTKPLRGQAVSDRAAACKDMRDHTIVFHLDKISRHLDSRRWLTMTAHDLAGMTMVKLKPSSGKGVRYTSSFRGVSKYTVKKKAGSSVRWRSFCTKCVSKGGKSKRGLQLCSNMETDELAGGVWADHMKVVHAADDTVN
jgi:hypothetical protein